MGGLVLILAPTSLSISDRYYILKSMEQSRHFSDVINWRVWKPFVSPPPNTQYRSVVSVRLLPLVGRIAARELGVPFKFHAMGKLVPRLQMLIYNPPRSPMSSWFALGAYARSSVARMVIFFVCMWMPRQQIC